MYCNKCILFNSENIIKPTHRIHVFFFRFCRIPICGNPPEMLSCQLFENYLWRVSSALKIRHYAGMKGDKSIWDIIYVYCVIQYNIILIFLDIKISCHVQNKGFEYLPTEFGNMQNTCINIKMGIHVSFHLRDFITLVWVKLDWYISSSINGLRSGFVYLTRFIRFQTPQVV